MIYSIQADTSQWPVAPDGKERPFGDYLHCDGKILIDFLHEGVADRYECEGINIPLFLTELNTFMEKVSSYKPTRWLINFSPFAHGKMDSDGGLLISSRSGKLFQSEIYDRTDSEQLIKLKSVIREDVKKYGSVKTS
jgi:hypothetical protein